MRFAACISGRGPLAAAGVMLTVSLLSVTSSAVAAEPAKGPAAPASERAVVVASQDGRPDVAASHGGRPDTAAAPENPGRGQAGGHQAVGADPAAGPIAAPAAEPAPLPIAVEVSTAVAADPAARPEAAGPPAKGDLTAPQPLSRADQNDDGANGQCPGGPYCSTRDGSDSKNGNGDGAATGKPCAGCVGKADNKNPPGQRPDGSDSNNGYECDGNSGIGRSNPAHTGCSTRPPPPPPPPPVCVATPSHPCVPSTPPPPVCVATPSHPCVPTTPPPPVCVATPSHPCVPTTPPPPVCVATPSHPCVPTTPPPPVCVATPSHPCVPTTPPPPVCVPAGGENKDCVAVAGVKSGRDDSRGVGSRDGANAPAVQGRAVPRVAGLAHTGAAGLGTLLGLAATVMLLGAGILVAAGRHQELPAG